MDALAGLLDGPRARGAFLLRMVMEPPWSVRIEDAAPICVMCVTEGEAWVAPGTGE
uniref:cupin domain-containing protein n=1 Tax=Streptomyces aureus TaxID=193461 RepID=UPI000AFC7507